MLAGELQPCMKEVKLFVHSAHAFPQLPTASRALSRSFIIVPDLHNLRQSYSVQILVLSSLHDFFPYLLRVAWNGLEGLKYCFCW